MVLLLHFPSPSFLPVSPIPNHTASAPLLCNFWCSICTVKPIQIAKQQKSYTLCWGYFSAAELSQVTVQLDES